MLAKTMEIRDRLNGGSLDYHPPKVGLVARERFLFLFRSAAVGSCPPRLPDQRNLVLPPSRAHKINNHVSIHCFNLQ